MCADPLPAISARPAAVNPANWAYFTHGCAFANPRRYARCGSVLQEDRRGTLAALKGWKPVPKTDYERAGNCDNTVFPCGALGDLDKDELRLYYGATDDKICLATGSIRELVAACKNSGDRMASQLGPSENPSPR